MQQLYYYVTISTFYLNREMDKMDMDSFYIMSICVHLRPFLSISSTQSTQSTQSTSLQS